MKFERLKRYAKKIFADHERGNLMKDCLRIRKVEEKIIEIYSTDKIQSPVHLSIGQEAVAVGTCKALKEKDWIFINYRGHAFFLARNGELKGFFAELMGKATGVCSGKGGSMHLADPENRIMGSSAIVGSTISHAVGAALAEKIKGDSDKVFVANFGDGAMEEGVFFESFNFASIHNLNVLFLCEDNGLAVHTDSKTRRSFKTETLAKSFNIKHYELKEGYDPTKVWKIAAKALEYIRKNKRPAYLKISTKRYNEHVGPGEDFDAGYRSLEEINQWKEKDPIIEFRRKNNQLEKELDQEIEDAIDYAEKSPNPTKEDLLKDVY